MAKEEVKKEPRPMHFVEKETKKIDVWRYKRYICKVKKIDIYTGKNIIVLNTDEAKEHDMYSGYRTELRFKGKKLVAIVDTSDELVRSGQIGVFKDIAAKFGFREGEQIELVHMDRPASIEYIKRKLDKQTLFPDQIKKIVQEIMDGKLSEIETSAWIAAAYINGFSDSEIVALTEATVESGETLDLKSQMVIDKHCIPGNVPTIIKNCGHVRVEPIGEIVENIFARSKEKIKFDDGAEYIDSNLNGLQVLTYDEHGNSRYAPVSRVYRIKSPKHLYRLILLGNREVTATSDHTIFVLKNGKIINKPIKDLKSEDYVVVPSNMETKDVVKSIEFLTENGAELGVTAEFMRFLGYYLSEGFTNYQGIFLNFGSHEKELIDDAIECINKVFGRHVTINKPHKTATRICIYSKELSKAFDKHISAGKSALEKRIPSFIFDVSSDMKLEFVKALFKGDGYVRRGYEAIYVTSSKRLSTDLQYLLSVMGMSVSLSKGKAKKEKFLMTDGKERLFDRKEAYYVYTQAREIFGGREKSNVAFINLLPIKELGDIEKEKIGWEFRKRLKEQDYMTKKKLSRIIDYIKNSDVKKLINGEISVLKVKSLEKIRSNSEYVYDFKVPGHDKFAAGTAPMYVHNCIGGVAGNRTTMLIVPIIAAAGLYIPKTSSRSITSASGTADTFEVLANVNIKIDELRDIVLKAKGAIVWGGGMKLAPVDDKLIRIRHPLSLDPEGMLLASILAKKKAVGSKYVIIDIPVGRGVKVPYMERAKDLAKHFLEIGKSLDMKVEAVITDGAEPIGNGVGPVLECRDVFEVLEGGGPTDLKHKSVLMAGRLLELCGKVEKGAGYTAAEGIVNSGKALKKMREIIELQGGNPNVKLSDLAPGEHQYTVKSKVGGSIFHIDNKTISKIARIAGSPRDSGAGIFLHKIRGDRINPGDELFTIHAESESKLDFALKALAKLEPVEMRKILLGTME